MSRPRLLYLVHRFPYPPNKGDRIRAFHIIKYLSTRSKLTVATLADEPVRDADAAELSRHCQRLEVVQLNRFRQKLSGLRSAARGRSISEGMFAATELSERINKLSREKTFDRVLLSASSMLPYLQLPALRKIPAVVDLVDVDSQKWRDYAKHSRGPARWLYNFEAGRLRRLETNLPANIKAVTLVSKAEAELYRQIRNEQQPPVRTPHGEGAACGVTPAVHAIPNGVDLDYFAPLDVETEQSCVFVGAMDYRPNIEGVRWFCHNVWPEVCKRLPEAQFQIVGRNPTSAVQQLSAIAGVHVTGSVDDVRPWLAKAGVVVAPLQIARGMQNKVIEAMAMAKPVIATPQALTGIDVRPDEHVLQAADATEFTNAVCNCLTDSALRSRIGTSARRFTEAQHHWDVCLQPFTKLLEPAAQKSDRTVQKSDILSVVETSI